MARIQVKKPNAVLMRVFGVICPHNFKSEQLNAFVRQNVKSYIDEKWGDGDLWDSIVAMKREAEHDPQSPKYSAMIANNCETDEKIKETVIAHVLQRLDAVVSEEIIKPHSRQLHRFVSVLWKYAYTKGALKTDMFEDVVSVISKWKKAGIKLFTISSLCTSTIQSILANTKNGDISDLFTEHVSADGNYKEVCEHVGEHSASCFYIVENIADARTIMSVGAKCALMNREAKQFNETDVAELSVINSFEDIAFVE